MTNRILNSDKIVIDFTSFGVMFKDVEGNTDFCSHSEAYYKYIDKINSKFKTKLNQLSTIFNLSGPGLIARTITDSNVLEYYLIPHGVRKYIYEHRIKEIITDWPGKYEYNKYAAFIDDSTEIGDTRFVINMYYPPMLLIAKSDPVKKEIISEIYGGFLTHEHYNFISQSLNVKDLYEFNSIKIYSEMTNTYDSYRLCLDRRELSMNYQGVMKIFDEAHNADLFKSDLISIFLDRARLGNSCNTPESFMRSCIQISKNLSKSDFHTTVSQIAPLKG